MAGLHTPPEQALLLSGATCPWAAGSWRLGPALGDEALGALGLLKAGCVTAQERDPQGPRTRS